MARFVSYWSVPQPMSCNTVAVRTADWVYLKVALRREAVIYSARLGLT